MGFGMCLLTIDRLHCRQSVRTLKNVTDHVNGSPSTGNT